MTLELTGKLIPAVVLLILGILEVIGGLYVEGKRSKNDFTIEIVSLVTLPTLIQPAIVVVVILLMNTFFPNTIMFL